jgi:hypothetical protein
MPVTTRSKTYATAPPQPSKNVARIDCSKMKPRPVSHSFVFPKSTEQKLAEVLAEIEALKEKKTSLEEDVKYWKEQHDSALERSNTLRERIANPFKGAIGRPWVN